ncbi:unnamed protein product [Oppiella nova]|uniref:Receptor ligand binding region domain-containing protein n=1 Tax=Oppiella nova TaxID=334625 RepID=A0A7R9MCC6_9ACAR|nr:unnamed protein product [Oppiella nova]CAG2174629.1 unnamed protein product [Oppiella nova]
MRNIYSIIVDTKPESLPLLLTADLETFNLEDFKYNYVNMTAFRLVDSDNPLVRHTLRDIERFQPIGNNILNKSNVIQAGPALMYDAVYALSRGLHSLQQNSPFLLRFPNNASCDSEISWTDGSSLFNYIDSLMIR